jgi:hypothetical protein
MAATPGEDFQGIQPIDGETFLVYEEGDGGFRVDLHDGTGKLRHVLKGVPPSLIEDLREKCRLKPPPGSPIAGGDPRPSGRPPGMPGLPG